MRRWIALPALFLFLSTPAAAFELGARAAVWAPSLSGDVRLDDGVDGDTLALDDDLGIDDEYVPFVDAWLWIGRHHFTFGAQRVDYSGSEALSGVSFGGSTFDGKTKTSLEYTALDLAYQFDLLDLENFLAGFSLGPLVQLKYLDGEVRMKEETSGLEETESFQLPVPMVGLGLHVGLLADILQLRARGAGIAYGGDRAVEAYGELVLTVFPFVELAGGYRYFEIDVDEAGLVLDYVQAGPYLAAGLHF